jgi:hypothetical protein
VYLTHQLRYSALTAVVSTIAQSLVVAAGEQKDLWSFVLQKTFWSPAAPGGYMAGASDIVGSTSINDRIGGQRWMELLGEHNDIVRREKALHGGYEVKTIGDALCSPSKARGTQLRCAIGVQRSLSKRNETAKLPIRIRLEFV